MFGGNDTRTVPTSRNGYRRQNELINYNWKKTNNKKKHFQRGGDPIYYHPPPGRNCAISGVSGNSTRVSWRNSVRVVYMFYRRPFSRPQAQGLGVLYWKFLRSGQIIEIKLRRVNTGIRVCMTILFLIVISLINRLDIKYKLVYYHMQSNCMHIFI